MTHYWCKWCGWKWMTLGIVHTRCIMCGLSLKEEHKELLRDER